MQGSKEIVLHNHGSAPPDRTLMRADVPRAVRIVLPNVKESLRQIWATLPHCGKTAHAHEIVLRGTESEAALGYRCVIWLDAGPAEYPAFLGWPPSSEPARAV